MLCYIKDFKNFTTKELVDCVSYSLPDGENGEVVIYEKDISELSEKYVGAWIIIGDGIYYISEATPNENAVTLTILSPIYAFSRPVEYDGSTTYGTLIANMLEDNFGLGCDDGEYVMTYLSVESNDNTPCDIETDDYGFIIPYEVLEDALFYGVEINFSFTNTSLNIDVKTRTEEEGIVLFNDGITTLESESYSDNFVAKISVIHRLDPQEGEEEQEEAFEIIDYYLADDYTISTTPPAHRAKGTWIYVVADGNNTPESVAIREFSRNSNNHKIEFKTSEYFYRYQPMKIRLHDTVFTTTIMSRVFSSDDNLYHYKCGTLATTLTEKIDSESQSSSRTIKKIKNNIAQSNEKINGMAVQSFGTWTPKLFDNNTELDVSLPSQNYIRLGDVYICYMRLTLAVDVTFETMLQIRNLPCTVIGGTVYFSRSVSGLGGTSTIQASSQAGRVFIRPNITGTITSGAIITGCFIGVKS